MRLPRFRIRTLVLAVAVAAVLCAIVPALLPLLPRVRWSPWSAGKGVPIDVLVTDADTGRPLAGAAVSVSHAYHPGLMPPSEGRTDAAGRLRPVTHVHAWGKALDLGTTRPFIVFWTEQTTAAGGIVRAAAEGYESAETTMVEVIGRSTIVIPLRRPPSTAAGASP